MGQASDRRFIDSLRACIRGFRGLELLGEGLGVRVYCEGLGLRV